MIPARVTLWLMLYFCLLCFSFSTNTLHIAIVSMVKYSEVAVNITRVCSNIQTSPSNTTLGRDLKFLPSNSQITLEWSKNERNLVLGALGACPWLSPFLGGFLSHKYGTKLVAGWFIFIPSIMSSLIPFVAPISPMLVAAVRMVQGILLNIAVPSGIYPIAGIWYPDHEQGKFFLVFSAFSIGQAVAFSMFGFIADFLGWPYIFHVSSLCSFIWFLLWQYFVYDSPDQHPRISTREKLYIQKAVSSTAAKEKLPVPWKAILTSTPVIVNVISHVGIAFATFLSIMYSPTYFKLVHGLSSKDNGLVNGLPYFIRAGLSCIFAFTVDCLMQKQISKTRIRNLFTFFGSVVSGSLLIGMGFSHCNTILAILLNCASVISSSGFVYGSGAGMVDMSPHFCGILSGIAGSISTLLGIVIPFMVTFLSNVYETDLLEQWKMVWLITGSINVLTGLTFILWSKSELQPWNDVHHTPSDKKLLQ